MTGCSSVQEHRARQFASDYAALSPAVQMRLQQATVAVGDSPKAVYFALGTPNYVQSRGAGAAEWVYWGHVLEEDAGATPPTLRFASRSEIRLPKPGEERTALRLHFVDRQLANWTLVPIDLGATGPHERLRMGTFPRIP